MEGQRGRNQPTDADVDGVKQATQSTAGRQASTERNNDLADAPKPTDLNLTTKSPEPSRNGSPNRPLARTSMPPAAQSPRSGKSSLETSPTRLSALPASFASIPSAAAVQRALSANRPSLPPAGVDGVLDGSRTDRVSRSGGHSPHWPISPRLRSPPPSLSTGRSSMPALKKADSDPPPPNISSKRVATASPPDLSSLLSSEEETESIGSRPSLRTPARGVSAGGFALETVAESSLPATPALGSLLNDALESNGYHGQVDSSTARNPTSQEEAVVKDGETRDSKPTSNTPDSRAKSLSTATTRPAATMARRSITNLSGTKSKAPVESTRSITVETETVTSVPQVSLGVNGERGASGKLNPGGGVRLKPSSETIRPKKDKKRTTRKPPSLHSGTVSSKADIFEAKVASAIDETNSSDSEETFVYESNPPERHVRHNHHSRTPSGTSLASQIDQHGGRNKSGMREGSQGVATKKSMKFTNNAYNNNLDGENNNLGSTRSSIRNGSSTPRHHHIGRHGRGGHTSLFDGDSPFTQANKSSSPRNSAGNLAKLARPNSPRMASGRYSGGSKKSDLNPYDMDDDVADDERTPLVGSGSVRVNRARHSRRPVAGGPRNSDYFGYDRRGLFSRYGACIIVTLLLLVLCAGASTFIMALNKPLMDVSIKHIRNVLASEQEIMLDLDVQAKNPNLFTITVNDLDVDIFAKSGYVGTGEWWREHQENSSSPWMARRRQIVGDANRTGASSFLHTTDGVDEGTDPIEDPEGDPQTMLLGRVLEFDSPLTFEPGPLRRVTTSSVGAIRLAKPGNQTEDGGSARWERVLQHDFDLIVRGILKYQLPVSSRTKSASISGRVKVSPHDVEGDEPEADEPQPDAPEFHWN